MLYRAYGLTIETSVPLLDLPEADAGVGSAPDVSFTLATDAERPPAEGVWFKDYYSPGDVETLWLSCAKTPAGFLLRFHDLADFTFDGEGRAVAASVPQGTPTETVRHLFLDHVLPLVLNLRGQDALHATAVRFPGGACAFTGPAGAGKSTLAASFLSESWDVLSDDCLPIAAHVGTGEIVAIPAYPGVRLWQDSMTAVGVGTAEDPAVAHYTSKRRVALHDSPLGPVGLRCVFVLMRDGTNEIRVRALPGRAALMELVAQAFRLDLTDRAMLRRQFALLADVASGVPILGLHLPDDLAALPEVRSVIVRELGGYSRHGSIKPRPVPGL